jgi:hypothetical protein
MQKINVTMNFFSMYQSIFLICCKERELSAKGIVKIKTPSADDADMFADKR